MDTNEPVRHPCPTDGRRAADGVEDKVILEIKPARHPCPTDGRRAAGGIVK